MMRPTTATKAAKMEMKRTNRLNGALGGMSGSPGGRPTY